MTIIATCAFPPTYDVAKSVELHLSYIEEAAAAGADLVVFPETSIQGYPANFSVMEAEADIKKMYDVAELVPGGPSVDAIADKAREKGIHVIYGLTEASDRPGVVYNTMVLTGPDGYIGKFRKVHVGLSEQMVWRTGDDWPVFETPFGRIGMLICYDKAFPESCRELTLRGADILVMSTAWPLMPGHGTGTDNLWVQQYDAFERVRAMENGRWFVSSNFIGELGGIEFFGMSQIINPVGEVVATTGTETVGLVTAEIDVFGGMADARAAMQGAFLVRDRRPDTYLVLGGELPVAVDG
ncbi:MAG: putative amidohydrolase [Frankiales bacterium]|jgi:predicted amidohydrolase|nr:putative amidohydrolase [Frankiales bacterium]MCW2707303.1 putative amidohydrolase [Frankiales bacterium]